MGGQDMSVRPNLEHLAGTWKLNKTLSSDLEPILALQGTNMLVRKAIAAASVTLTVTQPSEHEYRIEQHATAAAIPGTTEQYILDNTWRTNKDAFFGEVKGRSRWISHDEARNFDDLKGEWDDSSEKLILVEGGKEDGTWSASRIWGFEKVANLRRWTQRVKLQNRNGDREIALMVYDIEK